MNAFSQILCHNQVVTQSQFLNEVLQVKIQSFLSPRLVALLKAKEHSLSDYLPITEENIEGCKHLQRLDTQVTNSIS